MVVNSKREAAIAGASLLITLALYGMLGDTLAHKIYDSYFFPHPRPFIEGLVYLAALGVVVYGALLYHVCLIGNYIRNLRHKPASQDEIEVLYDATAPALTVLIPAYKEERIVMWQTMMSAALSEYPGKRVVLLIDDPHQPKAAADKLALETARALPQQMQAQFTEQAARFREAQAAYQVRSQMGTADAELEMHRLANHYDDVAGWLEQQATDLAEGTPIEQLPFDMKFFAETILLKPADLHRERAMQLRVAASHEQLEPARIARQYARLASMFAVDFSSFERKKYVNLSHDANKAMNLNSYMMLIGKSWQEVVTDRGLQLRECTREEASFTIPAADYIDTIDADSLMTHDYVARLIHFMEQPENARVAVAQSPCSSIPGSTVPIERVAGACIDVQFHTHQGYTYWDASFWVGANAMLRKSALEAIKEIVEVDGKTVAIYIQDRTVIEDTESTIDLVDKGWKLYNYPARMTYSTTPADFGSLLIQRRRWANGGLIILPKLLRYVWRSKKDLRLAKELFMRFNYLALTSLGAAVTIMLIFYSFSPRLSTPLLIYANIPLLLLYARDLKICGYRYSDALRICALNLMLFPIITAGVLKQFQQIVTGRKIPFGRTPKVKDRTAAPAIYYIAELAIIAFFGHEVARHVMLQNWPLAAYSSINMLFFFYALVRFIGIKAMLQDLGAAVAHLFRRARLPVAAPVAESVAQA
jgi:cellulose synthase/poly-beta-1,6-N-acetylglucosamine synthase-like glycosyltransferase